MGWHGCNLIYRRPDAESIYPRFQGTCGVHCLDQATKCTWTIKIKPADGESDEVAEEKVVRLLKSWLVLPAIHDEMTSKALHHKEKKVGHCFDDEVLELFGPELEELHATIHPKLRRLDPPAAEVASSSSSGAMSLGYILTQLG